MPTTTTPEYEVRIDAPGRRWKITHHTPGAKDGEAKVYFVSLDRAALSCSCPGFRFRKTAHSSCRHVRYVAGLLGKAELDPATPF